MSGGSEDYIIVAVSVDVAKSSMRSVAGERQFDRRLKVGLREGYMNSQETEEREENGSHGVEVFKGLELAASFLEMYNPVLFV